MSENDTTRTELQSVLFDMEASMEGSTELLSLTKSPTSEAAYRMGYYAAIRDCRRLIN